MAPPLGLDRGPGGSTRRPDRTKYASVGRVGLGFFPSARATTLLGTTCLKVKQPSYGASYSIK
jgi:hypothetical protein